MKFQNNRETGSIRRDMIDRRGPLAALLLAAISISGGEVIENPKTPSLGQERPELDLQFLREHAPVVSVLWAEEHHGASLVTFSLKASNESPEVLIITRDEDGTEYKRSVKVDVRIKDHIGGLEKLKVSTLVDDEMYFPGALLSLWITGLHDQRQMSLRVPPSRGDYSYTGDGQADDPDLVAWARQLFSLVLSTEESTK